MELAAQTGMERKQMRGRYTCQAVTDAIKKNEMGYKDRFLWGFASPTRVFGSYPMCDGKPLGLVSRTG